MHSRTQDTRANATQNMYVSTPFFFYYSSMYAQQNKLVNLIFPFFQWKNAYEFLRNGFRYRWLYGAHSGCGDEMERPGRWCRSNAKVWHFMRTQTHAWWPKAIRLVIWIASSHTPSVANVQMNTMIWLLTPIHTRSYTCPHITRHCTSTIFYSDW